MGSKLNGESTPAVYVDRSRNFDEGVVEGGEWGVDRPGREAEVVEAPSRMIAGLYCFLPGGHPVCFDSGSTSRNIRTRPR